MLPIFYGLSPISLNRYSRKAAPLIVKGLSSLVGPLEARVSISFASSHLIQRNLSETTSTPSEASAHSNYQLGRRYLSVKKRRSFKVTVTGLADKFKMEWPKITLFGDSITRRSFDVDNGCWASQIAYQVGSYFDVDARGFEGYNTKWGLELMPKLFPKSYLDKVATFVIFFGHNDSLDKTIPMHVPVADYEANLRKIIKYLEDNGLQKNQIIMITPSWYHHEEFQKFLQASGYPPMGKELEEARKYSDTVQAIGRELSIDVVDFFSTSLKQEPLQAMFCDGCHFSRLGAKLLADQLMPVIQKQIEARFGKALVDLWHAIPTEQHPEVKPVMEAYIKSKQNPTS